MRQNPILILILNSKLYRFDHLKDEWASTNNKSEVRNCWCKIKNFLEFTQFNYKLEGIQEAKVDEIDFRPRFIFIIWSLDTCF